MDQAAPAHQALHLSVAPRQGSGQFGTWKRQLGRPRKCLVERLTIKLVKKRKIQVQQNNVQQGKCVAMDSIISCHQNCGYV